MSRSASSANNGSTGEGSANNRSAPARALNVFGQSTPAGALLKACSPTSSRAAGARLLANQSSPQEQYQRTHFVVGPVYGTRCSTVVSIDAQGRATFAERSFDTAGTRIGDVRESFELERAG